MELQQLQYFMAVAKHEHVTKAANELHVTQSALSTALRKLEGDLGAKLYRKDSRGVALTPAGRLFLHQATKIISEVDYAKQMIRNIADDLNLRLRIGCSEAVGLSEIVYACQRSYLRDRADIDFINSYEDYQQGATLLLNNDIDMLLTFERLSRPEIEWHFLRRDRMMVLAHRDSRYVSLREVSMSDIAGEKLLSLKPRSFFRENMDELFAHRQLFTPADAYICFSASDIPALVSDRAGLSIIPELCWEFCRTLPGYAGLAAVPVDDPSAVIELGLARLVSRTQDSRHDAFFEFLRSFIENMK